MMTTPTFALTMLLLPLLLANSLRARQAADATLKVIPEELELAENDTAAQVVVVLENSSDDKLDNLRLSWFTNSNVKVLGDASPLQELIPHGSVSWSLRVAQTGEGPVAGSVHFRADYAWRKDGAASPRVAFSVLNVKSRPLEAVAEVEVKTTLESLNEQRAGKVYLVIKNISNVPIHVQEVQPHGPKFIAFKPESLNAGLVIKPLTTGVIAFEVKAKNYVQSGKHLLLFDTQMAWEKLGRPQTGNLVATHEVNVGVLGESEILTALGVPSFLILPGFLALVTVGLLWRLGFLKSRRDLAKEEAEFPLQVNTPEFWLVAITLSGIIAVVYPWLTKRSYLEAYGLSDIVKIWLASIFFVGAGTYIVVISALNFYKSRRTPSENDDPLIILEKLHRQKLGVSLERVETKIGEEKCRGFLLEPRRQNRTAMWVGPPIELEWLQQDNAPFQQKVNQELTPQGEPLRLAQLLQEGTRNKMLQVRWRNTDQLNRPHQVPAEDITFLTPPRDIIIEQM